MSADPHGALAEPTTERGAVLAAWGVALVASVAVLGPALGPGLVLGYDQVWTPDQPLVPRSVGIDAQLPRAVPVDAVVAVLDDVVPASLLQKLALLGALVALGAGCGLLAARVAGRPVASSGAPGAGVVRVAAAVAAGAAVWNPFVAQRLAIGHWSLLVGVACLPWVVRSVLRSGARRPAAAPVTVLLLALGAVTPTGGVLVVLAFAVTAAVVRPSTRVTAALAGSAAVVNAPWWVPGLVHPATAAVGAGTGVAEFALRAESVLGPWVSAAGLGGIWNGQVVTSSRALLPVQLASVLVLALALVGLDHAARRARVVGGLLAGTGLVLALASTVPEVGVPAVEAVVSAVPGAGLLRDSQKWLALVLPVLAVAAGVGAARLAAGRRPENSAGSRPVLRAGAVSAGALLLVVATVPDAAGGVGGRLQPVRYPADWACVAVELADAARDDVVLALPFQPFRRFAWNDDRTLLDPAPRWFAQQVVVEDRLTVGSTTLTGESAWADRVRPVLAADGSARDLARTGVSWVLIEKGTPGEVPQNWVAGAEQVYDGPDLALYRLPAVSGAQATPPLPPANPVLVADAAALLVVAAAALQLFRRRGSSPRRGLPMLLSGHRGRSGRG